MSEGFVNDDTLNHLLTQPTSAWGSGSYGFVAQGAGTTYDVGYRPPAITLPRPTWFERTPRSIFPTVLPVGRGNGSTGISNPAPAQLPRIPTTPGGGDRPAVSPELAEIEAEIRRRINANPPPSRSVPNPSGPEEITREEGQANIDIGNIYGVAFPKNDTKEQESDMAIDWGQIFNAGIDIAQGQQVGGGGQNFVGGGFIPTMPAGPVPQNVTVNTATGKITPCRRRRRRRLLTPTDLSDLAALATIVGKGDALKLATVKAVRR